MVYIQMTTQELAYEVISRLKKEYPDADCTLDYDDAWKLLVSVRLAAQCTDARVNTVTPVLFGKWPGPAELAKATQEEVEAVVRSTGFYRNKAKNIRALCAELEKNHGGRIPDDLDVLISLPGIGRKTANLLIATAYGKPGIIVDTHFKRLSNRLGFTKNEDPDKIEFDLKALLPEKDWSDFSHCMVFHGRRCCFARKPNCAGCPVKTLCPSAGKC